MKYFREEKLFNKTILTFFISLFLIETILIILGYFYRNNLFFNLSAEANLPTWFSSIQLFSIGIITVALYFLETLLMKKKLINFKRSWLWLFVAFVFFYLSADETAQIHETLGELFQPYLTRIFGMGPWLLLYMPFIVFIPLLFLYFFLSRFKECKPALICALIGLAFWSIAIFGETIIRVESFPRNLEWVEKIIEEGSEMIGSTLFLLSFALFGKFVFLKKRE